MSRQILRELQLEIGIMAIYLGVKGAQLGVRKLKEKFDIKTIKEMQEEARIKGEDLIIKRNGKEICVVL